MVDMDAVDAFRKNALNPNHPVEMVQLRTLTSSSRQEKLATLHMMLPAIVQEYMDKG